MFVAVMAAIGLFVMRLLTARPLVRELEGATLRALSVAFTVSAIVGLIAIPVYLDFATANDTLRSAFDLSALVPLFRVTAFGRAIVDFEVCFALFCVAAWIALWVDRPERPRRSVAELIASCGALLAAAAVVVVPGAAGHAAQTRAAWTDAAVRLAARGLRIGVARRPGRSAGAVVQRDPARASGRVVGLRATFLERSGRVGRRPRRIRRGRGDQSHAGCQRAVGDELRSGNPGQGGVAGRCAADRFREPAPLASAADRCAQAPGGRRAGGPTAPRTGQRGAGGRGRRGVRGGRALEPPPPPPAFALENSAIAKVGPGRVAETVRHAGYVLQVLVSPNKAAAPDSFALRITKGGQPVRGANVTLLFNHLEMEMPTQEYQLTETQPGIYSRAAPALVMVGRWGLTFQVTPRHGVPFTALDRRSGRRMKLR